MNQPIFRLFVLVVVLFTVLVGFSSRWAVFGAPRCATTRTTAASCSRSSGSSAA